MYRITTAQQGTISKTFHVHAKTFLQTLYAFYIFVICLFIGTSAPRKEDDVIIHFLSLAYA